MPFFMKRKTDGNFLFNSFSRGGNIPEGFLVGLVQWCDPATRQMRSLGERDAKFKN